MGIDSSDLETETINDPRGLATGSFIGVMLNEVREKYPNALAILKSKK